MNQREGQLYRARKAAEYKFVRGWTHQQIADELDVTTRTVSRLRGQLAAAERRAREAETPQRVFEYDDDGNLKAREIHFEGGGSKYVPKVKGMEMAPDHKVRAAARQEERRIIDMLWSLAGGEEPDQLELSGEGGGALEVVINHETVDE